MSIKNWWPACYLLTVVGCNASTAVAKGSIQVSVRVDSAPVSPALIGAAGTIAAVSWSGARLLNDSTVEVQSIVSWTCIPRPSITAVAHESGSVLRVVVSPSVDLDVSQPRCQLPIYYPYRVTVVPVGLAVRQVRLRQAAIERVTMARDTALEIRWMVSARVSQFNTG